MYVLKLCKKKKKGPIFDIQFYTLSNECC